MTKLTPSVVFARDPEEWTPETREGVLSLLRDVVQRIRKARQDDAEIAEEAEKIKKRNAVVKKKKSAFEKKVK